ncbi:AraC family transcriptional regulator [Actinomadura rayongensis]|uniref:Helix-turn-helix domain-containing protein n=1 Tax=Actinomadura rayongensis TaxID=1429076 RepID=A0A6I4WGQ2_9ACTN|nr:AraC family transcriptional regulator [Actinomadura rayongensis]MXQ68093.1 helix-turn-helix domain-containing protein [Actinomadura rayongensis]
MTRIELPESARADDNCPADLSPPLLTAYQRVASNDIHELHGAVEPLAVGHTLDALEPRRPLDGMVNGLSVGSVNLVWVRYGGSGVVVETPPTEGEFAMCAPNAPMGVEYCGNGERTVADGTLVLSHEQRMRMTPHPTRGCLVIATSTGRLADHLRDYLGRDAEAPLRFGGTGPAAAPLEIVGRTWRHVCSILDHATADGLHPLAARNLEDSLLTAVLLGLPHTATAELTEPPRRSPHHLADVIHDWIQAHYDQPIGVADMARAAGISVRHLQFVCRNRWGLTPTQLLRGVRLDQARRDLLAARPGANVVTRVAHAAGYVHMSRFSTHYRQRFGETPTQTLRRGNSAPSG